MDSPCPPKIRHPAPDFNVTAWEDGFRPITLKEYKGKYVVLFFWPLDFTFVCPTEIIQFSDKAKAFREIECEVIGCSIDSQFTHMEYCSKPRAEGGLGKMDIPLIADLNKEVTSAYGVLCDKGDEKGVAYRATFIIDREGILRHYSINDLPVGRNVEEVLRLVKAFQYADEFGEVCPAQWQPGDATMVADPTSNKTIDYWKNVHAKK